MARLRRFPPYCNDLLYFGSSQDGTKYFNYINYMNYMNYMNYATTWTSHATSLRSLEALGCRRFTSPNESFGSFFLEPEIKHLVVSLILWRSFLKFHDVSCQRFSDRWVFCPLYPVVTFTCCCSGRISAMARSWTARVSHFFVTSRCGDTTQEK